MAMSLSDLRHNVVLGLLLHVGYFGLMTMSLSIGMTATGIAMIMALQPALVGLLSTLHQKSPMGLRTAVGLAVGTAGALLVVSAQSTVSTITLGGTVLAVIALFAISISSIWESKKRTRSDPLISNAIHYSVGLAILAPLAYLSEPIRFVVSPDLVLSLLYLVFGNSLLAIYLLLKMLREGDATRVSSYFFLVPPLTLAIAVVVLGESFPLIAFPGIVMAALGVYLSNTTGRCKTRKP